MSLPSSIRARPPAWPPALFCAPRPQVSAESGIARTLQQLPSMGGGAAKAAATRERLQEVVASTLLFKGALGPAAALLHRPRCLWRWQHAARAVVT